MSLFEKSSKNKITKNQVKALLPVDFPERMADYFQSIFKQGKWTTSPGLEKDYDKFIVLALLSKGDGRPLELESTIEKEGVIGKIPTFECDLTPYNLDLDQAHIFIKYIGKIVAYSLDFDMQDWRSSILWSDSQFGGTDKIVVGRGYKRLG